MKDIYVAMEECLGVSTEALAKKFAERRLLPLQGKIDREKADKMCQLMVVLDLKETAPITLLISSPGGNAAAANYIGSVIQTLNSPVDGLVIDRAGSMAVDILQMCRTRRILPGGEIFVHFTRTSFEVVQDREDITENEISAFKRKLMSDRRARQDLYSKRLGITQEKVNELLQMGEKYEIFYSAQEALELRLVDEIDQTFKFFPSTEKKI